MTVGAALSILGTNSNTVLAGPRYLFALAEDGFGPRGLSRASTRASAPPGGDPGCRPRSPCRSRSPAPSWGSPPSRSIARLATYVGTAAAVPVLRRKLPDGPDTVRLPGGPLIPIAAVLLCLVLAASTTVTNLLAGALALAAGAVLFRFRRREP